MSKRFCRHHCCCLLLLLLLLPPDEEMEEESDNELQELEEEDEEDEEAALDRAAQVGARTETYDEGTGSYEVSQKCSGSPEGDGASSLSKNAAEVGIGIHFRGAAEATVLHCTLSDAAGGLVNSVTDNSCRFQ